MEIHELNTYNGNLDSGSYVAIDNGTDTGKVSYEELTAPLNTRIDNIIAGPASSAEEVVDARLGADGITYSSLGTSIRKQFDITDGIISDSVGLQLISADTWIDGEYIDRSDGSVKTSATYHRTDYIEIFPEYGNLAVYSENTGAWDAQYNVFYDEDYNYISNFYYPKPDGVSIIVPPAGARYIRMSCNTNVTLRAAMRYHSAAYLTNKLKDTDVRKNFNTSKDIIPSLITSLDFEQGGFLTDGRNNDIADQSIRLRSKGFIPVEGGETYVFAIYTASTIRASFSFYDDDDFSKARLSATSWLYNLNSDSYLVTVPASATYARITLSYSNGTDISPDDLKNYSLFLYKSSEGLIISGLKWGYGAILANTEAVNRQSTGFVYSPYLNSGVVLLPSFVSGYVKLFRNGEYYGKINSSGTIDKVAGNWMIWTDKIDVKSVLEEYEADYLIVSCSASDITAANYSEWADRNIAVLTEAGFLTYWENKYSQDAELSEYVIGADMIKRRIKVNPLNKQIAGYQACCKYGDRYYSTDGESLFVQDSNFDVITSVAMNLGHGNGLQLGSSNIAYASGWNDGKVYAVNLDNLSIVETISLPVGGYTTCAVDDLNKIIYIFYRETLPDTDAVYEFIVYDYDNEEIISRKYINTFKAMQSCDYYFGKIAVAYGLSDGEAGIFVYNTSGDMLADFKIGVMSNTEPEGLFFARDTKELYFTLVNKAVFSIQA